MSDIFGVLSTAIKVRLEQSAGEALGTGKSKWHHTLRRAHGLIKKVPHTHRYQLTDQGRRIIPALMAARNVDANQLSKIAA